MTDPVAATDRDLRRLAGIVSERRADIPAYGLPMSLLRDVKEQVGCDVISFEFLDSGREVFWFGQAIWGNEELSCGAEADDRDAMHWEHYWACRPCSYPDRTGDLRSVISITDFYSDRQWHSTGMYCDLYRPQGLERELMLTLPTPPGKDPGRGKTLRLFVFRGASADFCEADRGLLTLLRPHLYQAYLDAERHRHPACELTPRQWQLMDLLAAGHTNTQIARRLGICEGTVRTHLENIYRRLQVSSRTAAVTLAFGDRDLRFRSGDGPAQP